jgi:ABC-2 type transport system ATP-binding protein
MISAGGLTLAYPGGPRAVAGVALLVDAGEIYGFLGPEGAGKSTTIRMLTALLAPSSGTARVAGFDVVSEASKVRRSIGVAPQGVAIDGMLSGREHLEFQGTLHDLGPAEARRRGKELLDRVGLSDLADRRIGTYSGGMKRRLDLAVALVHRPRVLFLDEPTTGLDPASRSALWTEVARLSEEEGVTVFLATQYLEEADALARRVGIIDRGKMVAEGTPTELKAELGGPSVELRPADPKDLGSLIRTLGHLGPASPNPDGSLIVRLSQGEAQLTEVVRLTDKADLRLSALSVRSATLDDVFLTRTGRNL